MESNKDEKKKGNKCEEMESNQDQKEMEGNKDEV